ncbi:Uma2 family endonuclease [Actinoplanes sp. Pm04-4]|uniref:Uma2 family endonuclease n=1 Tax=Paractinoplanes pyxinae TaxID=2997416 RepID=A0ABT4B3R2_9ACTN|nr:Uma2 family endonuclease [Actinoplanes pyxinae]MCY1141142.1 Uma2 family endonuclease [Actinoplanes pyxinae]
MSACDTLPMTEARLDRSDPWTESEYLALGETRSRIELVNGGLLVSPAPDRAHQDINFQIMRSLYEPAKAAGLRAFHESNLRLGPDQMLIPDLIVGRMSRRGGTCEASEVALVGEILSPSTAPVDRGLKRQLYAAAKIDWYLLIEPDMSTYESVTLRLLRRRGTDYEEAAVAKQGETLQHGEPFPFALSTTDLIT